MWTLTPLAITDDERLELERRVRAHNHSAADGASMLGGLDGRRWHSQSTNCAGG